MTGVAWIGLGWAAVALASVWLVATLRAFSSFTRQPGAFRCAVRSRLGRVSGLPRRWPWRMAYGIWVRDVLLVRRGLSGRWTIMLSVDGPDGDVSTPHADRPHRLGRHPVVVPLCLDDGRIVEVAAAGSNRAAVVGPFLAAAIPGLAQAPTEPPPRR